MRPRGTGLAVLLIPVSIFVWILAEISLLIWVAGMISWWWTLVLLVGSAVLGVVLVKWQWAKAWSSITEASRSGHLPPGKLADASLILLGGALLIIPGLITDVFGLLLLIPPTRRFARAVMSWAASRLFVGATTVQTMTIEGEVVEEAPSDGDTAFPVIEGTIIDDDGRPI